MEKFANLPRFLAEASAAASDGVASTRVARMKRLVLTLSSLALVGACGRVSHNGVGGGGAYSESGEDGLPGTAGRPSGSGGKVSSGSTGTGGKATGSGGKTTGSGATASSMAGGVTGGVTALGGDVGVGGSGPGAGGAPPNAAVGCNLYCSAYAKICPQAGHG